MHSVELGSGRRGGRWQEGVERDAAFDLCSVDEAGSGMQLEQEQSRSTALPVAAHFFTCARPSSA